MKSAHQYGIRPKDPGAHLYEVTLTVENPAADGQIIAMPAWIPGSYMIRDYAKHVVAMSAESDGRSVPIEKLDKSRWQAAPTDRPLTFIAEIYAYDPSVRGAHLDTTHAYFNGPCVFPEVVGQESDNCIVEILPPDPPLGNDWRVATAMYRKGAKAYGFGHYEAADYAELIDHPVEIAPLSIGEFEVRGIPHTIAIRGNTRADMARLCHNLQSLCTEHMALLGAPADFDRYLFLLHAPGSGYGGLEHRWSSSLICSRDNLPARGDVDVSEGYRTFLGLASHEYFHLWNIKRLKPAAFTPYDLSAEIHTGLLWVFEGITSYYDDLVLARSGLITIESYLELLGQTITRVMRGSGRFRQSIEESSFDAWTKFYKKDANASNAVVSYYAKGALVALTLDLKLRSETDRQVSLDDVMQTCWQRWGETRAGMPEHGFEIVCAEVSGFDLEDFFDAAVRGTGELPLEKMLASHGVALHLRHSTGPDDKGGKPAELDAQAEVWLGASLVDKDGRSEFTVVHNGGPAEQAGIAPGDVAVALDGLVLAAATCEKRLRSYRDGDVVEVVVFREDQLIVTELRLAAAPTNTCYLQLITDADEKTELRRSVWLQSRIQIE